MSGARAPRAPRGFFYSLFNSPENGCYEMNKPRGSGESSASLK
jgi:hypothetical protein